MPNANQAARSTEEDDFRSLILIGRIFRAHGVRGEVKVIPETDDPERFRDLECVRVGRSLEKTESCAVETVRFQQSRHGVTVILKLQGVASREEADALRQALVYAREEDLPPLAEDELFIHDLIGLQVVTEDGAVVGAVKDILEMPGHDTLLIERDGQPDAMIPLVPEFIVEMRVQEARVVVRLIEGLLE